MKQLIALALTLTMTTAVVAQSDSTSLPALPNDKTVAIKHYSSERISDEMDQISQTFRSWRRHAPSHEAFYDMIHRLEYLIQNNPRDRGCAYMRMGQMYRTIDDPALRSYPKAIECYTQAIPNLTHPDDIDLLGMDMLLLGRCYLQEGPQQDIYLALKYFSQAFSVHHNMGTEYAQMYLFGWGVPQDLYLAACIYDLQVHSDNLTDLNQLDHIRYLVEHPDKVSQVGREAWEDYVYTGDVKAQRSKLQKSGTVAARGGVCEAMREMGLGWADGNFGGKTSERRKESFKWLRQGADNHYVKCMDALALLCQREVMDTARGDIFKTDKNGQYKRDDVISVNRQCMALMERAANLGDAYAQRILGEWYVNDDMKAGIETNYLKAAYWLHVAAFNGDAASAKMLKNIRPMIDQARKKAGEQAFQQLISDAMMKADETQYGWALTMQKIKRHSEFNKPKAVASMLPIKAPSAELLEDMHAAGFAPDEAADYLLAVGYKTVYDRYEQVVMGLMREKDNPFTINSKQYFQTQMSQLRRRAEMMPHCLITQVSPVELK